MLAAFLLSAALLAPPAAPLANPAKPADLAFLQGDWEGGSPTLKVEERWTEEAGGLMLGVGRTFKGERAVFFEFLRIEFRPDAVYYVAQPKGGSPTEFKLTAFAPGSVTFENPTHDHPKSIRYERAPDGGLVVDLQGDEGKENFRYQARKR